MESEKVATTLCAASSSLSVVDMSFDIGVRLKTNMENGLPTRTKGEGAYRGQVMKPCGDFARSGNLYMKCPWLHLKTQSPIINSSTSTKLHDDIASFVQFMRPRRVEVDMRKKLVQRFTTLIESFGMNATAVPVGSYVTGLYLPSSDIDMVLVRKDRATSSFSTFYGSSSLSSIRFKILASGFSSEIEDVTRASVPLIRIVDKKTDIQIDLTAADAHGIKATQAVQKWLGTDREIITMLVTVVKMFLSIRRCGTTYTGGINSYVLVWMVVAWVHVEWRQKKPQKPQKTQKTLAQTHINNLIDTLQDLQLSPSSSILQSQAHQRAADPISEQSTDFGEILMRFFQFYGCTFDYYTQAITIEPQPAIVPKVFPASRYPTTQRFLLSIFDPADRTIDMGSKAYGIIHIKESFKHAYMVLDAAKRNGGLVSRSHRSLLGEILDGDFTEFLRKITASTKASQPSV